MTEDDSEAKISDANRLIEKLVFKRLSQSIYSMFSFIKSKANNSSLTKFKKFFLILTNLEQRRTRPAFSTLRHFKNYLRNEDQRSLMAKKKEISINLRKKQMFLFLKLISNFAQKSIFKHQSYFLARFLTAPTDKVEKIRLKKFILSMQRLILKRLGPSFKNIHGFKCDTYSSESVEHFTELMQYFMSNRLSQGFASVRSYVMHFEVLKVEEIPGDEYKSKFMEIVDKYKGFSERSFDINNLSGMVSDEIMGRPSVSSMAQYNLLDNQPVRGSSRAIPKK